MKTILSLIVLIVSESCYAQVPGNMQDDKPYIEVTGHAEKKVIPDEIYLSITIKERESGRDKITIEQQETELKDALRKLSIPIENLAVADAQADYIRVKWSKKDVISQSEYELKLLNAQQVADVFEKLDDMKIDNAYIDRVSHSKIKEYRKEVEIDAIKEAKSKADYLLNAIGQQTGMALIVNQRNANAGDYFIDGIQLRNTNYLSSTMGGTYLNESKIAGTIEFQKIKLESTIYVKFEIK